MFFSLGKGFSSLALSRPSAPPTPVVPQPGIFGFTPPLTAPSGWDDFPGRMLTEAQASLTDLGVWSASGAAASVTTGSASIDGTQGFTQRVGATPLADAPDGHAIWQISRMQSVAGGNAILQFSNATGAENGSSRTGWRKSYKVKAGTGPITCQIAGGAGVAAEISRMEVIDMTALLAQKWVLVGAAPAQSNWVGTQATGYDPDIDTPVPGCVTISGVASSSYGVTAGNPTLAADPISCATLNTGGGPGGAFLRELRRHIPADYTIVYVATAYGGSTGEYWDPDAPNPVAYTNFFTQMRAAWAAAPAGSVMGGIIVCQGEGDSGAEFEVYGKKVLDDIRAEPGWGEMPIVFSEIGGSNASVTPSQLKFATGSGDALEMTRCSFVPRPAGWAFEADNLHFDQPTHRLRGVQVAQALRDLIYP